MAQQLQYLKISELPSASVAVDNDVLIINHDGITSKIKFSDLMSIINEGITTDITDITERLSKVETATSTLATTVKDNTETISNIITAGFNLIGIDTK